MSSTRCDCIGLLTWVEGAPAWTVIVRDPDCLVHRESVTAINPPNR